MRFSMDLRLTSSDLSRVRGLEENCSRQISVVNDIYSWEKEYNASLKDDAEGSVLCSAVSVLMEEIGLSVEPTKRVLWQMVREWEELHDGLVETISLDGPVATELRLYMKGLEYQMSGNELWSMTTLRYGKAS
jgi:aristolochene synthase